MLEQPTVPTRGTLVFAALKHAKDAQKQHDSPESNARGNFSG